MRPTLLHGLVAPVACAACAFALTSPTQAEIITVSASGSFLITETTGTTQTLAMDLGVTEQTGGFGFVDVALDLTRELGDPGPDPMAGMLTLFGATPADFITASFDGVWHVSPEVPVLSSFAGSWSSTDAGGSYVDLVGAGAFGGVTILMDEFSGTASFLLTGEVVPAAPALGLIGMGLLAGARRRRA